ncbi:hypothetical protein [Aliarcobacter butzleri]|uniref:hypothetical protein n=1 Tax=Aliarcobacter butzleri TaxID=28197 RepID=UPI00126A1608|nr:hypothetical protein [Aliarcobacter butzleri]
MNNTLIIKAFFRMIDEKNESLAIVNIEHEVECNDKRISTKELYLKSKEILEKNIHKDYKLVDLTKEEMNYINEDESSNSLQIAIAKGKYCSLFKKYKDDDILDVKTAKEMIDAIFKDIDNEEKKELNCFVIGLMDLQKTSNLITKGENVFLKASYLSALSSKVDMENIEDIINLNLEHLNYEEIHNFCTDFLLAEAQGLINSEIIENFK